MTESRPRRRRIDGGFTLIEISVTLAILGILTAIGVWGLSSYTAAQNFTGTANDITVTLRNLAEQSQAEGRTYCVSIDSATTWSIWRYSCESGWSDGTVTAAKVGSGQVQGQGITLGSVSFVAGVSAGSCPSSIGCIYFYPRGTASDGSLQVQRPGHSSLQITVVGLTGRVSQS